MPESLESSISAWIYGETGLGAPSVAHWAEPLRPDQQEAVAAGIPDEEVKRRIVQARSEALLEARNELEAEARRADQDRNEQICRAIQNFKDEREVYFHQVEGEVVRLALAIARKILEREAMMDPSLLGALVRIALERMQAGSGVRVRVAPAELEHWTALGSGAGGTRSWEAIADERLAPGDCLVETEMGVANFGFDAQLAGVEQTVQYLLAARPRG